jgi:hypothetical protein
MQLQIQLAVPLPYDLENINLLTYKHLQTKWRNWETIKTTCIQISQQLATELERPTFEQKIAQEIERDRRITKLDDKLNHPQYWIGSAGYPEKEAIADMNELLELEEVRLYNESDGQISHQDARKKAVERHPITIKVRKNLERSRCQ